MDMGGTTTDIARIREGKAAIKKTGAKVGGWNTRIRAAELYTVGIGGDSRISYSQGSVKIGPKRVCPLCVKGSIYPSIIHEAEAIKSNTHPPDFFALPEAGMNDEDSRKEKLVEYFKGREPRSLSRILRETDMTREDIYALADEGVLDWIALTPTDILHAQGKCDLWDEKAAQTGVRIFAGMMGISASGFLAMIECHITDLLCAAINDALENFGEPASKTLAGRTIIAIGAPVKSWMPQVNEKLDGRLFIPEYAEVANAVGAAIGQVIKSAEILIRPAKGLTTRYNLYAPWEYLSFETLEEAVQYAVPAIKNYVSGVVENTGARIVEVFESQEDLFIDSFTMESKEFVESRIRATAIGAPKYM
jgi:N-methylhydantoinase A/oxoprolinase/acetone carboxylase beta subunit